MHYIKTFAILNLAALFLVPINSHAQKENGFSITGKVKGLREGDKILLTMMIYMPGEAVEVHVDSSLVKNGEFKLKGTVPNGPRIYWMRFVRLDRLYRMFLDNGQDISVHYDSDIAKVKFQLLDRFLLCDGSPSNTAYHLVWSIDDMYSQSSGMIKHEMEKVKDSIGYDRAIIGSLIKARMAIRQSLNIRFLSHIETELLPGAALFGMYEGDDHDAVWQDVYDQMDDHLRNSVPGKMLETRLPLLIGKPLPSFSLPNAEGKMLQLKDLCSKSKLTLVRCWASNSYERNAFDLELRNMYNEYHAKGFNILAVSSDSTMENWKNALEVAKYPWANVIDLHGKTIVDPVYKEYGNAKQPNTTNILLDPNGNIIAWDAYGLDLHWYLDSILNPGP